MNDFTWLIWEVGESSDKEEIIPKYEIEDKDPDNWKQGEEHDLEIKRTYPVTLDGSILLDITCEGGDITKGEQLTDDGSAEWKGDITVLPAKDRIEIKIKSDNKEVELEEKFEILPIHLNWNHIKKYEINGIEPIKGNKPKIKWETIKGTWNESNLDDAYENKLFTCVSPGSNGITTLRCSFQYIKSITFTYCSNAESNYDYLIVSKLNNSLNSITSWNASSNYNKTEVQDYTRGNQNTWRSYTYEINDENEYFVEFMFGKDNSNDTQPDNAQVYISNIENDYTQLETISYPQNTEINWTCELEEGYEAKKIEDSFILTEEININPNPTIMQLPIHIVFNDYIEKIVINDVEYFEDTTIYKEYGTSITWEAFAEEGYVNKQDSFILKKEIYISPKTHRPSYILYTTSNNQPIDNSKFITNTIIINNEYDENTGKWKVTFEDEVTSIGDSFLTNCTILETIDLTTLSQLTSIGDYFLAGCDLNSIDFSNLSQVTSIGKCFLQGFSSLTSINLTPLSQLTSISEKFLYNCENLQTVNLSGLSQVTSIGKEFLYNCGKLQTIDLSGLSQVTSIDTYFLYNCKSLTSIDLSDFTQVTSIGTYFLYNCKSLTSIDLSSLSQLTFIDTIFLSNCSGLQSIDLTPLSQVIKINNNFLSNCSSLQSIDLSPLSKVTSIGDYFLRGCSELQSIDLSPLLQVTSIGNYFLYECSNLKIFIIDHPEGLITLPLEKSKITPDSIYVNDKLLEQYKEAVPNYADKFKPLSEYNS